NLPEDSVKDNQDKIQKLTQGKSLKANIELVYNNARLAADIAVELSKL
ncbi:MAG: pseudouridine-5'-phosphate glycosidase, partial [Clostridia bacterium]